MIDDEKLDLSVGRTGLHGWGETQISQGFGTWHEFKIFIISPSSLLLSISETIPESLV